MQSNRRPSLLSQFGRLNPWLTVLEVYHVGRDVKATVVGSIDYGMLVELNSGIVALLRKGDIDWVSIEPMQALRIGEVVDVRIIGIDPDRQRMYVSRRVLLPNPIDAFVKTAQVGAVYLGTVRKCVLYGAFVELEPGVHGLLHNSKMTGHCLASASKIGDNINVRVIGIDQENRRIELDLERTMAAPDLIALI
ncbi:MAG: S1 RNA-binding domain-containing protein [Propionivibrio sp.]|nr:S1 RNA-binding domain-containing protein [Propionivibrio sp.]